jgi:D-aminopeptidase
MSRSRLTIVGSSVVPFSHSLASVTATVAVPAAEVSKMIEEAVSKALSRQKKLVSRKSFNVALRNEFSRVWTSIADVENQIASLKARFSAAQSSSGGTPA